MPGAGLLPITRGGGLERCQSGRLGQSRKLLWVQAYRGFESHPLRQKVEVGYLAVGRAEGDFMPFATVQSLPWHPQRGLR